MPARTKKIRHDENTRAKWYVYKLIDPRDGTTFYVGKGCGARVDFHEAEVRNGRARNLAKAGCINGIWASGHEVGKEIVARFEFEPEAFALEKRLIGELNPRANIAGGTTRIISLLGLIAEMATTWRDLRPQMVKHFPRECIPAELVKLYDSILVSPRFGAKLIKGNQNG